MDNGHPSENNEDAEVEVESDQTDEAGFKRKTLRDLIAEGKAVRRALEGKGVGKASVVGLKDDVEQPVWITFLSCLKR